MNNIQYHLTTALQRGFERAQLVSERRQVKHYTDRIHYHFDPGMPYVPPDERRDNQPERIRCRHRSWLNKRIGYVYFLWVEGTQWVKIGKSIDPEQRTAQIFTVELPFDFYLMHVIRTDDMHILESSLHRYYGDKRGRGEWFRIDSADLWHMKSITHVYFHKQDRLIVWPEQQYLPYPAVYDNLKSA